ncbi:PD-(D/E)XK nuclease family protein [Helicobacter sp. MIT 01-3238]|uniref:PDDEXK-like family protein n=1 Tax=Helicobacter sp. MIT 01-3238 TaxID=398627 RepID=UPI000E1E4FBF|nr:PD-(D/E)XK nuclease family protein [Helicobacter sp. MIT 01-3238]RDU53085.1 hypothetical protein CQA40_06040 [Helicobacter sp. MIT 01-3238]
MSENTKSDFDSFISRFGDYVARANESKKRGNNDYNPLKAVQNPYNEVNMHSGFIYSLLDTNGKHYQDDLFLSLFLEVLGLKEWFGSTTNAQVRKESNYIDLYIFNDTKHIIIENKINADDQPNQIATFIETIHNNGVEYENIFVIFLTLHDREPNQSSRTNKDNNLLWEIKQDSKNDWFLESKDGEKTNKVGYKKVLYGDKILEWIESCQSKSGVGNIANLNYALESYKDIVQIITNNKENTMSIVDFFKEAEDFKLAFEIIKNTDKIIQELVKKEMCKLFDDEKFKDWKIEEKGNRLEIFNTLYEKQFFRYKFVLGRISGGKIFGVRLYEENLPKEKGNLPQEISKHQYADTKLEGRWLKGWVSYTFDYCKVKNFKDYFVKNYEIVNKINEEIAKLAKEVKDYQMDS